MQRVLVKIRGLAAQSSQTLVYSRRLLHSTSPAAIHQTIHFPTSSSIISPLFRNPTTQPCYPSFTATATPSFYSVVQVRHVSSRERKKRRKPMTPVTSKVKKVKIKPYSSYKSRFRTLNDGSIRRWHEGKNHNAHMKSKKSKRRLRQPALVPAAYAKVMKKLNFCA